MRAGCPTLGAADMEGRAFKFHVRPLQLAKLAGPQAMPEADQDHCAVPGTVTIASGSLDQFFDLALGQMFTRSQLAVRTPRGHDCPFYFGWRHQPEVWFPHGFRLSTLLHCPYSSKNTDSSARDFQRNG